MISWNLKAGEVLILTGGSFQYNNYECGGIASQLCVLAIKATKDEEITIDNLVPKNNWLAVSRSVSPDEAVSNVQSQFWLAPNCGSGCSKATVAVYTDLTQTKTFQLINAPAK